MLIANKYEVPETCPSECKFKEDLGHQGSLCCRCPVFNCEESVGQHGECYRLIEPENYRADWSKEWFIFFNEGTEPKLYV